MKTVHYILLIVLVILSFVIPTYYYPKLPETIPVHFDATGTPDTMGSRYGIFLLPIIGVVMSALILLLTQAQMQGIKASKAPRLLPFILVAFIQVLFLYINYGSIQVSLQNWESLGEWFLPIILAITFLGCGYLYWYGKRA